VYCILQALHSITQILSVGQPKKECLGNGNDTHTQKNI